MSDWRHRGGSIGRRNCTAARMVSPMLIVGGLLTSQLAYPEDRFECLIQPEIVAEIGSATPGVLESVAAELGSRVNQGEVLATLIADVDRAAVEVAKARYESTAQLESARIRKEFSERRYKRISELSSDNFASAFDVDEAHTEHLLAEMSLLEAEQQSALALAELQRARALLELKTVKSPFAGVVTELYMKPGERVDEQPILRLAKVDPLIVEVLLPIRMLDLIEPGDLGVIATEQHPDARLDSRVVTVDPVVDAASGLFRVRLELPNSDGETTAGLECSVTFDR